MHRPLTQLELLPSGPLRRIGAHFAHFESLDSTNDFLLHQAPLLPDGSVVVAEAQTSGRGRLGRRWIAPRGSSILLSVLLIESPGSRLGACAPQLACLAVCDAIDAETECRPRVRWPNDVVVGHRKLAGVLVESTQVERAGGRSLAIVIGIGLNCLQQVAHFADGLERSATSLEIECAQPIHRPAIARHLLHRIDERLGELRGTAGGVAALRQEWLARCDDLGSHAILLNNGHRCEGTILDITEGGDLLVQLAQGGPRRFESATTTRLW